MLITCREFPVGGLGSLTLWPLPLPCEYPCFSCLIALAKTFNTIGAAVMDSLALFLVVMQMLPKFFPFNMVLAVGLPWIAFYYAGASRWNVFLLFQCLQNFSRVACYTLSKTFFFASIEMTMWFLSLTISTQCNLYCVLLNIYWIVSASLEQTQLGHGQWSFLLTDWPWNIYVHMCMHIYICTHTHILNGLVFLVSFLLHPH